MRMMAMSLLTIINLDDVDIELRTYRAINTTSSTSNKILEDEIFGPVLPIISYKHLDDAIAYINSKPKPLALYVFSKDSTVIKQTISHTSSGGVTVNDTLLQYVNHHLPFGGVGSSGMGSYHGKYGFIELSHLKAVVDKSLYFDAPQRYPPYTEEKV